MKIQCKDSLNKRLSATSNICNHIRDHIATFWDITGYVAHMSAAARCYASLTLLRSEAELPLSVPLNSTLRCFAGRRLSSTNLSDKQNSAWGSSRRAYCTGMTKCIYIRTRWGCLELNTTELEGALECFWRNVIRSIYLYIFLLIIWIYHHFWAKATYISRNWENICHESVILTPSNYWLRSGRDQ
jgi:hypothetical protein